MLISNTRRPVSSDAGRRFFALWTAVCCVATTLAQTTSAPTLQSFRPGIRLDWTQRAVHVDAEVVLDRGPLEFVACWGGKEHESLVRMHGAASDLFMALGLLGHEPGAPPKWDDGGYDRPTGPLLEVLVRWNTPAGPQEVNIFSWVRSRSTGAPVAPLPWIFTGSLRKPGPVLRSDTSGAGFAVVDQPDSFLQLDLRQSNQDALLWLAAHPERVPPIGAPVTLVIRAASHQKYDIVLDANGALQLNGAFVTPPEMLVRLELNRRIDPSFTQVIVDKALLEADRHSLRTLLQKSSLPTFSWKLERSDQTPTSQEGR